MVSLPMTFLKNGRLSLIAGWFLREQPGCSYSDEMRVPQYICYYICSIRQNIFPPAFYRLVCIGCCVRPCMCYFSYSVFIYILLLSALS